MAKSSKTKDKRNTTQRLADEALVAKLMLEQPGISQMKIAQELGISQPTVSRHKAALYRRWIENAQDHFTEMMLRQVQESQWRYDEAREAWEASKEPKTVKSTSGGRGVPATASVMTADQNGDPRFLDVMRKEAEYQAKLLGLMREQVDVTSNGRTIGVSADVMIRMEEKASTELDDWEAKRFGDGSPTVIDGGS